MPSRTCNECNGEGVLRGTGDNVWRVLPWVTLSLILVATPCVWLGFQWSQADRRSMCDAPIVCPLPKVPKEFADIPSNCGRIGAGPIVCSRVGDRLRLVVESTARRSLYENVIYIDNPEPTEDGGVK